MGCAQPVATGCDGSKKEKFGAKCTGSEGVSPHADAWEERMGRSALRGLRGLARPKTLGVGELQPLADHDAKVPASTGTGGECMAACLPS